MKRSARLNTSFFPTCPPIAPELVAYLDQVFPNRCLRPGMSIEDGWIEAGSRKVIDHLLAKLAEQGGGYDPNIEREALG